MLLIGLSLTLVLSFSLSPAYAAKPPETPKGWLGTQVVDFSVPQYWVPEITPPNIVIHVIGTRMIVTKGYNFDNVHVAYELITSETITIPLSDLSKPSINLYDYPHSGNFEWHTSDGKLVGTGEFKKNFKGPPYGGSLSATLSVGGKQIRVEGIYWVTDWEYMIVSGFPRVRVPVELNHAGLYFA